MKKKRESEKVRKRESGNTKKQDSRLLSHHSTFSPAHLRTLTLFLFAFLLYSNTLNHGFVMDDGAVITDNVTVQKGFSGIKELFHQSSVYGSTKENFGNYRPLTMTLFAIEWQLFGNNPSRYHLVHVSLYALCCVVLFLTLKKLLQNYHPFLAFVATLLFVAHPLHTEVGANIKSVDEILSLMFCMAALYFAIEHFNSKKPINLILSGLFFVAGLFSKETSITFLVVIPLAIGLIQGRSEIEMRGRKQFIVLSSMYLAAVIFYLLVRNAVLDKTPETMNIVNNALAGATSFSEKFGTIFYILIYYIKLLVYPHPLSWDYSYNQIPLVTFSNIFSIISVLFYAGIAIYSVVFGIRRLTVAPNNKEQATNTVLIAFCVLFFLITLSVSSNIFVLIAATMAERFLFIPSVAFCILLALAVMSIKPLRDNSKFLAQILIPLLIVYSMKTFSRNKDWKSNYSLFAAGVQTSPNSYRANSSFGWQNLQEGQKDPQSEKGKEYFTLARTYYQRAVDIYGKTPDDWFNLGVTNYDLGNQEEAMNNYLQALKIRPNHRNSAYNLASIYFSRKNYAESVKYFQRAYDADTTFFDALFKAGVCQHWLGDILEAIRIFEKCLSLNPDSKDAVTNLSVEYKMVGNNKKADYYSEKLKQMK